MATAHAHSAELRLAGTADAPRRARDFLTASCDRWGVPELVETGALAVSELVTNAVRHAGTDLRVELRLDPGPDSPDGPALTIAVHDSGGGWPVVVPPDQRSLGGRGLAMVAKVAEAWGAVADDDADDAAGDDQVDNGQSEAGSDTGGKSVWCRIRVDPRDPRDPASVAGP
jgi:anti-sigma regulatory factor (Ser/Thr protein kinase)